MQFTDPPFPLGDTLQGFNPDSTSELRNRSWLGSVFLHDGQNVDTGPRAAVGRTTGKGILAVALKNTSGLLLQPKRLVLLSLGYDSTATHLTYGSTAVLGYTTVLPELAGKRSVIVDPFLSGSVADNDIFWGVISGIVLVKTGYAGDASNSIAAGAPLVAATLNTTSGNSTAGGIGNITLPGTTGATKAFFQAANMIGYAISAKTTAETNEDILIDACIRY